MNWQQLCIDYQIDHEVKEDKVVINCPMPSHGIQDVDKFMALFPSGACSCWVCGAVKRNQLIKELLQTNFSEVNTIISAYAEGKSYRIFHHNEDPPVTVTLGGKDFTKGELKYLRGRSIDQEQIDTWDIRSGGIFGDFAYRIVFPVKTKEGLIVSARGRAITKDESLRYKALHPTKEAIPHKRMLFGEDKVIGGKAVVVEGEIDTIKGGPGFLGAFGAEVSDYQIIKLAKFDHVMVALDDDAVGRKKGDIIANKLAVMGSPLVELIYIQSKYKDLGETDEGLLSEIRQHLFS
jgi:hypothetical protein